MVAVDVADPVIESNVHAKFHPVMCLVFVVCDSKLNSNKKKR